MTVTLVLLPPRPPAIRDWSNRLAAAVPEMLVLCPDTDDEVRAALAEADAAYGTLGADLLASAGRLRWLQAPQAGPPPEFYHRALVDHPVQVTNMRDTYTDHVATHTVAMVLALARGLPRYARDQRDERWAPDWDPAAVLPLAEATALVVGVGAVGAEVGRMLAAFGTRVTGVDARLDTAPPGFAAVYPADSLDGRLPDADVVILTVPDTPATRGLMDDRRLALCKPSAYLVNVGRGPTVRLDDLTAALEAGRLGGAALDVFDPEPLPPGHPLWKRSDVLITPHVAGVGPHADERRFAVLLENARRFAAGRELVNIVDKTRRF
jgi:phosphoglycerate dehydrogenase-like enzyme